MTVPFPFQRKGVKAIELFGGRALLGDEQGLGKTLQALLWKKLYLDCDAERAGPTVVVCPAYLKWNWEAEVFKHFRERAIVLEKMTPPGRVPFLRPDSILIINYEILGSRTKGAKSWVNFLKRLSPSLVIIDECQAIRDRRTKRTKACVSLCLGVPHVIAMSGTPMEKNPAELFPVLNILAPDEFPSFFNYSFRYCNPVKKPWGWEFKGASNAGELHNRLKTTVLIRRRKADVLKDLPVKNRVVVPLEVSDVRAYEQANRDFLGWVMDEYGPRRAEKAARAEAMVKTGYMLRLAAKLKKPAVREWLRERDGRLLVFGVHKEYLDDLHKEFKPSLLVNGDVTGRVRKERFDTFNGDRSVRWMFGNIDAAGAGWSCRATSEVAFVEFGWTPGRHRQAEDRVHGIQRGDGGVRATYHYLFARGTIEEDLAALLQENQRTVDAVLEGKETGELDLFDKLMERVAERGKKTARKKGVRK